MLPIAEIVISSEIYDVCWNGHYKCGAQSSPQGREAFVPGDLPKAVVSGGKGPPSCFIDGAVCYGRRGGV